MVRIMNGYVMERPKTEQKARPRPVDGKKKREKLQPAATFVYTIPYPFIT